MAVVIFRVTVATDLALRRLLRGPTSELTTTHSRRREIRAPAER